MKDADPFAENPGHTSGVLIQTVSES